MNGKKAFTLVELLIVITVFVIIFILLTPLVNRMRDRANMIKCSNNIRLISLALHMYAADHNEIWSPARHRSLFLFCDSSNRDQVRPGYAVHLSS